LFQLNTATTAQVVYFVDDDSVRTGSSPLAHSAFAQFGEAVLHA
jgi:hypothetical protein